MNDPAAGDFRRHYSDIYRFVRRRSSTAEDAEDLTQDVFEAAVKALGEARLAAPPPLAWLYTVARRRLIDAARRARTRGIETLPFEAAVPAGREDRTYGPRLAEAIGEALRALTEAQRRVIVLKLFEGRSFAEIAREVGAGEDACKMRFARGLERVREELERKAVTPS